MTFISQLFCDMIRCSQKTIIRPL